MEQQMARKPLKIYMAGVEGDSSHTPVFFTNRKDAEGWVNAPDMKGDWYMETIPDACELLSDMASKIHDRDVLLSRACWLLVQQLPMTNGRVDPSKYDQDNRDAHEWLARYGGEVAEIHHVEPLE
jgi:hypothetical protein